MKTISVHIYNYRNLTSILLCIQNHRESPQDNSSIPVPIEYFKTKQVEKSDTTLKKFLLDHNVLNKNKFNLFLELDVSKLQLEDVCDVILMDKVIIIVLQNCYCDTKLM